MLLFFQFLLVGQNVDIPENTNLIKAKVSFEEMGRILVENEFEIKYANKEFGTMVTEIRSMEIGSYGLNGIINK